MYSGSKLPPDRRFVSEPSFVAPIPRNSIGIPPPFHHAQRGRTVARLRAAGRARPILAGPGVGDHREGMTPGSAGRWGVGRSKRKERVDAEVRAALAEFAAAVEVRVHAELERSRQTQVALIDAVRGLQAELDNRDQALAHALERIGQAIDHSSETIDARARGASRAGRDGRQAHAGVATARAAGRRDRAADPPARAPRRRLGLRRDRSGRHRRHRPRRRGTPRRSARPKPRRTT